jgi:hypothetical protein
VGKLNIAKDRLYLAMERGGLGLICLEESPTSQQANWITKAGEFHKDNLVAR